MCFWVNVLMFSSGYLVTFSVQCAINMWNSWVVNGAFLACLWSRRGSRRVQFRVLKSVYIPMLSGKEDIMRHQILVCVSGVNVLLFSSGNLLHVLFLCLTWRVQSVWRLGGEWSVFAQSFGNIVSLVVLKTRSLNVGVGCKEISFLETKFLGNWSPFCHHSYHIHYFDLERKEGNILVHYLLG